MGQLLILAVPSMMRLAGLVDLLQFPHGLVAYSASIILDPSPVQTGEAD
jgi:hypothetical protein